jgi:hypothetical protein
MFSEHQQHKASTTHYTVLCEAPLHKTDFMVKTHQIQTMFDVRGSVHHSTIHKEKFNKMQQCIKILLFHIYMKLNMFRATRRSSSGV